MTARNTQRFARLAIVMAVALVSGGALADDQSGPQTAAASSSVASEDGGLQTIFVTARKRVESEIAVPVSVHTLSAETITQRQVSTIQDVATLDPSLTANVQGTATGGQIFLRGVGTSVVSNASFEQSVLLDLDGVPVSRGNMLRVGFFDLEQISVLKGPQALFFGKNSPAGVISVRSADPTDHLDSSVKLSYEPYARERLVEGAVGGPLVEGLRGRLFAHYSDTDGNFHNLAYEAAPAANAIFPGAVQVPSSDRAIGERETFVRGTLLFDANDRLTLRAKGSYYDLRGYNAGQLKQTFYCPQGHANETPAATQLLGAGNPEIPALASALAVDDCKLNDTIYRGGILPAHFRGLGEPNSDPDGFTGSKIGLLSLDASFAINDDVSLKLVAGYIRIHEQMTANYTYSVPDVPLLDFYLNFDYSQFSQEARIQSSWNGPVNFMVGAFLSTGRYSAFNQTFALYSNQPTFKVPNTLGSGFGQLIWNITHELELAGGARYTEERKDLSVYVNSVVQPTANPSVTFTNTSPEATLTWRPTKTVTVYGAFKEGFKAGGYSQALSGGPGAPLPTNPLQDYLYQPESAKGAELGAKALLLDQTLSLEATLYKYRYSNLQVSSQDTSTGVPITRVTNAASANQKGVDLVANFQPRQVRGLSVYAAVNYNPTSYGAYLSPCWIGQSIAEGCSLNPGANGHFTSQNVAGHQLINAPMWVGATSVAYTIPLSASGMLLQLGGGASFKSSYNPAPDFIVAAKQSAAWLFDAQVRLFDEDRGWEVAVFGKNLGNVYRAVDGSNAPLTGNSALTGTAQGGVGARADLIGNTNAGRAVYLQLMVHPNQWFHHTGF